MPYGYNSLNDTEIDDMKIGLCPVCNKRLTAECGHSTTIESQEWMAAHIVAEQELYNERHPADVAKEIESHIDAEWKADVIADAEFDADTKRTQEWSL